MSRFQRLDYNGRFYPGVARFRYASRLPLAVTCRAFGAWVLMSGAVPGVARSATASLLPLAVTRRVFGALTRRARSLFRVTSNFVKYVSKRLLRFQS